MPTEQYLVKYFGRQHDESPLAYRKREIANDDIEEDPCPAATKTKTLTRAAMENSDND